MGRSHLNLPCSWAFFRTSSREEPAGTETECLYEGEMPETSSVTSMNSGTWVCGRISVAGSNRAIPGRGEGAAALRIRSQALVLLSSQEDCGPLGPPPSSGSPPAQYHHHHHPAAFPAPPAPQLPHPPPPKLRPFTGFSAPVSPFHLPAPPAAQGLLN